MKKNQKLKFDHSLIKTIIKEWVKYLNFDILNLDYEIYQNSKFKISRSTIMGCKDIGIRKSKLNYCIFANQRYAMAVAFTAKSIKGTWVSCFGNILEFQRAGKRGGQKFSRRQKPFCFSRKQSMVKQYQFPPPGPLSSPCSYSKYFGTPCLVRLYVFHYTLSYFSRYLPD